MAGQTFVALPAGARTGGTSGPGVGGILGAVGGYFNGGSTPSSFNPNPVGSTSISPYSSFASKLVSGGYAQPAPTTPFSSSVPTSSTPPGNPGASPSPTSGTTPTDSTNTSSTGGNTSGGGQSSLTSAMEKNIQDSLNATRQSIYGTIGTTATQFGSSIQDQLDQLKTQQEQIDQARVQNELARMQGRQGVLDMVGNGIRSGAITLDNANASNSSAADALARAYGLQGRQQLAGVNEQYAQGQNEAQVQQDVLNQNEATFGRHVGENKQSTINNIVNQALSDLGNLNREASYYGIQAPVDLQAERNDIISRATDALSKYDNTFSEGYAKEQPATTTQNQTKAGELLAAGTAPQNAYTYTTVAPGALSGTGPFASSLPIFTLGG